MHSVPLTLNAFVLASTAIATGPMVATAARRSDSLPNAILTTLVADAPELFLLYWHDDCYIHGIYIISILYAKGELLSPLLESCSCSLCQFHHYQSHISMWYRYLHHCIHGYHRALINSTHIVKMLYMYIKQYVVV